MKIKSIIITSVVALGLSVSAQANAQESAVERLMSSLISSAVSVTQAEISREVQQNIANATYHVSLSDAPVGKVSVQELAANTEQNNKVANTALIEAQKRRMEERCVLKREEEKNTFMTNKYFGGFKSFKHR